MIAKQYKQGTKTSLERGKNGFRKGSRTGLERGKNGVGTGAKPSFKRHKKWNLARFENLERRGRGFFAVPHLSSFFSPLHPFFHPFLTIFAKNGKKGCQNMEERERKEKRSFQFLSHSQFSLYFLGTSLTTTSQLQ